MIKNKPVIVLGSSLVSSSLPKLIQEVTKDELKYVIIELNNLRSFL